MKTSAPSTPSTLLIPSNSSAPSTPSTLSIPSNSSAPSTPSTLSTTSTSSTPSPPSNPSTLSAPSTPSAPSTFPDAYLSGDAYLLTAAILEPILAKDPIACFPSLNSRIRLNGLDNLSEPELHYVIGRYQEKYDSISNISITLVDRRMMDRRILIVGRHETGYCFKDHCRIVRGNWQMDLVHQRGAWVVVNIQIEGIDFEPVFIHP